MQILSTGEICMKFKVLFSGNNIISLSSAELDQSGKGSGTLTFSLLVVTFVVC